MKRLCILNSDNDLNIFMTFKRKEEKQKTQEKRAPDFPRGVKHPQLVKGMKDVLPSEQVWWEHIRALAKKIAEEYCFERIDTPLVEQLNLFTAGIGKQTDIVEKEMYSFVDQGGDTLALRPEFTAGICRAYIEHGMISNPQPVKLYTIGQLFRHDKPQEGRYRQHTQFNCEVIGEGKPAVDAQLILIGQKFLSRLGLKPITHINSIGCRTCRTGYKELITEYFRSKRSSLCEDCKRRLSRNVLRLLDCKNDQCQDTIAKSPPVVDSLCEACKDHFIAVLEFLDELEIPYQPNPHLVRGLDYYTRTVFEFYVPSSGVQSSAPTRMAALGGGGRYDTLIEMFGGAPTPAAGFGIGIERAIIKIKEWEKSSGTKLVEKKRSPHVYLAQLGEQPKRRAMVLYEELLAEGFLLAGEFSKDSLKSQLEMANRLGARLTLILGQKELLDGSIIIRNMEGGEQEVIDIKKLIPTLHKKLGLPIN